MNWTTIGTIAGVLASVAALILHSLGILEKLFTWLVKIRAALRDRARAPNIPRQTLVLGPAPHANALWWHMGANVAQNPPQPMMQVCADLNATNVWEQGIRIEVALLRYRKWGILPKQQQGHATLNGAMVLAPNATGWVRAHFMFAPPWKEVGRSLAANVAVVDQFNNRHWVKRLHFPYL